MPPPLFASDTATRVATHWVVDALAGDEALDFSVLKALVGVSPECLKGAPEATRERVELRCLQEVASGADAEATAGVVRVEASRSCEDLLLELIGELGSSGTLEKDMLLPFSQDIRNVICMKKSTLPETLLELLKEVDPEITSVVPPAQLEQYGTNQHDKDQSLCSSRNHVNIEQPRSPTDNVELQQLTKANLVDETESRNLKKDPITRTFVLDQQCTSDTKSYDHLQEDDAGAVILGARPPEKSPTVKEDVLHGAVHASAGHDATLLGSITEPLLKKDTEVHAAMVPPPSPREQSPNLPPHYIDGGRLHADVASNQSLKKPSHEGLGTHAAVSPSFDRSSDDLPTNASEPGHLPEFVIPEDSTMISPPHSSRTDLNALQHESGEKENQVLDDVDACIQPVEKDHVPEESTLQASSALHSVCCNDDIQGGRSETNHLPGNTTEHTKLFEEQNGDKSHIEKSGADKVKQALHDDASISEKMMFHGGLNVQAAPSSQNYNSVLHDKISEANYSCEQNTGKSRTDVQKNSCSISVPNSAQDVNGTSTTNTSKNANRGDTSAGMPHVSSPYDRLHGIAAAGLLSMANKMSSWPLDQDIDDSLEGLSQQDLCIKCSKAGQLLKCSGCMLAAHDSCFGSSATFQETDLFYCPVCFYRKATEAYQKAKKTYCEARKNLANFLGTTRAVNQHDEQLAGVLPRAPNGEGQSSVSDPSKRKTIHQHEATNLAHRDEEPDQQRKKQKLCAVGNGYPERMGTEKATPVKSPDNATINKHSVLKNNELRDAEPQQQGKNKEVGNGNLFHVTRSSSQSRGGPANQEVEADKEDGPTKSHQSNDSDEIEATSSNDSGKQSPPRHKMRHSKSRL